MEHKVGIHQLEQLTNEQVGAAAKALLLTWMIAGDLQQIGEPEEKLEHGIVSLLHDQALDRDTEVIVHAIGYIDRLPAESHDMDVPQTPEHEASVAAARLVAKIMARIIIDLS